MMGSRMLGTGGQICHFINLARTVMTEMETVRSARLCRQVAADMLLMLLLPRAGP